MCWTATEIPNKGDTTAHRRYAGRVGMTMRRCGAHPILSRGGKHSLRCDCRWPGHTVFVKKQRKPGKIAGGKF